MTKKTVVQCKTCPWRVDCEPAEDIPRYDEELHQNLRCTINSGLESMHTNRGMACHYSKPGAEADLPCAGWLHNQLGAGNNIGVRLSVMTGKLPIPEVDGPQHEHFEDTLPRGTKKH